MIQQRETVVSSNLFCISESVVLQFRILQEPFETALQINKELKRMVDFAKIQTFLLNVENL